MGSKTTWHSYYSNETLNSGAYFHTHSARHPEYPWVICKGPCSLCCCLSHLPQPHLTLSLGRCVCRCVASCVWSTSCPARARSLGSGQAPAAQSVQNRMGQGRGDGREWLWSSGEKEGVSQVRERWSCWGSHQQSSHVFYLSFSQASGRKRCLQVALILLHKIIPRKALGQLLKGECHLKEQCKAGRKWGGIATLPGDMGTFAIGFLDTEWKHSALCSLQKPIAGVISSGQHPAQQDPSSQLGFWDIGDI